MDNQSKRLFYNVVTLIESLEPDKRITRKALIEHLRRRVPEEIVPSEPVLRHAYRHLVLNSGINEPQQTGSRTVALSFVADRKNVYGAWNALANLADLAGAISISATATAAVGYDKAKLENGVLEPLRELGLIEEDEG